MPTRSTFHGVPRIGIVLMLIVGLVGCSPASLPASSSVGPAATAAPPSPTAFLPSPTVAGLDGPPEATLAAEGGDPVTGQLGTYAWFDSGSDSPWLPGAPIAVGAGEPLTVDLVPAGDLDSWTARYVPAAATGPAGALALGEGAGDVSFSAPGPGAWTVEVAVVYAAGAGSASYFWRLEVE